MLLPSGDLQPQVLLHSWVGGAGKSHRLLCSPRILLPCCLCGTSAGVVAVIIFKRTVIQGLHVVACGGSPCEVAAYLKEEERMASLRGRNRDGEWSPELGAWSRPMGVLPQVFRLSCLWAPSPPMCVHILAVPPPSWNSVQDILLSLMGRTPQVGSQRLGV